MKNVIDTLMKIHMIHIGNKANEFQFQSSEEYEDNDAYDKAYEIAYKKYQESCEKWSDMRRRMAREDKERQGKNE